MLPRSFIFQHFRGVCPHPGPIPRRSCDGQEYRLVLCDKQGQQRDTTRHRLSRVTPQKRGGYLQTASSPIFLEFSLYRRTTKYDILFARQKRRRKPRFWHRSLTTGGWRRQTLTQFVVKVAEFGSWYCIVRHGLARGSCYVDPCNIESLLRAQVLFGSILFQRRSKRRTPRKQQKPRSARAQARKER